MMRCPTCGRETCEGTHRWAERLDRNDVRTCEVKVWRLGETPPALCGAYASFVIDGKPMCQRHAGMFAIELLVKRP